MKAKNLLISAAIAAPIGVMLARTAAFKPEEKPAAVPDDIAVDGARAVESLAQMVRFKTVSNQQHELEDAAEFDGFRAYLVERYPNIHKTCELERIGRCGLLYRWKGRTGGDPAVFMAHYDVVPANEEQWSRPAFEGVIEDGVLWGRGTLDTKGTLAGVVEAAEQLIGEGFVPESDIYLAFSGEEEISGDSALDIVKTLEARGISPALVIDEGGAVVNGVFPGVKQPCALIGTAEKGQMFLYMEMKSQGGHASAPPPHSILGRLAKAVVKIENKPFPFDLTPPAAEMFDTLGRRSTLPYRLIFSNLWLFRPVLDMLCKKSGGELNALVRTTTVTTQASGSAANNVIPPEASVGINVRLTGGQSTQSAIERLQRLAGDRDIVFRKGVFSEPSAFSATGEAPGWKRIVEAVERTWPEALVSPFLMIAGSDSRHYSRICEHVYRFCPMTLTSEERATIHGNDERIPAATLEKTVAFYLRLMKLC